MNYDLKYQDNDLRCLIRSHTLFDCIYIEFSWEIITSSRHILSVLPLSLLDLWHIQVNWFDLDKNVVC